MVAQGRVAVLRTSVAVLRNVACRMLICGTPSKIIGGAPDTMEVRAARRTVVTRAGVGKPRMLGLRHPRDQRWAVATSVARSPQFGPFERALRPGAAEEDHRFGPA
jgi:hypothetical protein